METLARLIVAYAPYLLACVWPFARIVRGRPVLSSFFFCWALLVVWYAFFITVLPSLLYRVDKPAGLTLSAWEPEDPAVIGVAFLGWFPAGITVLLAVSGRALFRYLTQKPTPPGA